MISGRMIIPCETVDCHCPSAAGDKAKYSFTYINNMKNFIYYDVPKAGSSTIRKMLWPHSWPFKPTSNCVSKTEPLLPDKQYKTFTFVRNPYDRMVSNYRHFNEKDKQREKLKKSGIDLDNIKTFTGFIKMTLQFQNHHWQPQSYYVPETIDFVGKIETFQQDFDELCEIIKIPRRVLLHENQAKNKKTYTQYYDDEALELVANRYRKDITRFNYKFEG